MFGKEHPDEGALPKRITGLTFQSPCAGNMFGKSSFISFTTSIILESFNPRVRGTCLVSYILHMPSGLLYVLMQFQSPCAGNMFGKRAQDRGRLGYILWRLFQSPCAGNMFGKERSQPLVCGLLTPSFNPRVRGTCLVRAPVGIGTPTIHISASQFQSPCAGNMFGKDKQADKTEG